MSILQDAPLIRSFPTKPRRTFCAGLPHVQPPCQNFSRLPNDPFGCLTNFLCRTLLELHVLTDAQKQQDSAGTAYPHTCPKATELCYNCMSSQMPKSNKTLLALHILTDAQKYQNSARTAYPHRCPKVTELCWNCISSQMPKSNRTLLELHILTHAQKQHNSARTAYPHRCPKATELC